MAEINQYGSKRIIVADLDGTLTPSKGKCDAEMAGLIAALLLRRSFAVIGGGPWVQFKEQILGALDCPPESLKRLYLFPTCASALYTFTDGAWRKEYSEDLDEAEKQRIYDAFHRAIGKFGLTPATLYGEQLEDRGSQITFSALGQRAPLEAKSAWDPDAQRRKEVVAYMKTLIPEFEIRIGGTTSIDVTRKGIDKAYGIQKISSRLGYALQEMLFVGDAIFEGGNDYPVVATGIAYVQVKGPEDTKRLFSEILKG